MTWDDVFKFVVMLFCFCGSMLFLGAGVKWIEKRWLK